MRVVLQVYGVVLGVRVVWSTGFDQGLFKTVLWVVG